MSEERAGVTLALLEGDRNAFIALCDQRHDEVDVTQIFDWTTDAFGFTCKPTTLDAPPSNTRYVQFRTSYNQWVEAWDPTTEPDPRGPGKISQWGRLDTSIWGAIFDLYEYNLRGELGEDAAGVAKLREKLVWVDPGRKSLGFSEHHPVDNLGRDGYRSQANRRVEVLFFDEGEEPDMDLAATAPEQSELYSPGKYKREHLGAMLSAKPKVLEVLVEVGGGLPWTDTDALHILDASGTLVYARPIGDGVLIDSRRCHKFVDYVPGAPYCAEVHFAGRKFVLFDQTGAAGGTSPTF